MPVKFLRAYSGASLTYFLQCAVACTRFCQLRCWTRAKPPLNLLGGGARLRCDPIYVYALTVFLAGSLLAVRTSAAVRSLCSGMLTSQSGLTSLSQSINPDILMMQPTQNRDGCCYCLAP